MIVDFHISVSSLFSKMNMIKFWINSTDAEIVVLSETWLIKSVQDGDVLHLWLQCLSYTPSKKRWWDGYLNQTQFDVTLVVSESVPI